MLQKEFCGVLKNPRAKSPRVKKFVAASANFTLEERLDVYQYAYKARLVESLREDFPNLLKELGDAKFDKLMDRYLEKHPSTFWSLGELGKNLPRFIKNSKLSRLAHVEWTKCLVFSQVTPDHFDFTSLSHLPPEILLKGKLKLNPTLHFLKNGMKGCMIFKSGFEVKTQEVSSKDYPLFLALTKRQKISRIIGMLAKRKIKAEEIFATFSHWAGLGLITGFEK